MRKFFFRASTLFLCAFLLFICVRLLYYSCSDGFSLRRIHNTIQEANIGPVSHASPTERELNSIQDICKSPFRYLKKGSQAYAFEDITKRYVLKLYKCHHLHSAKWLQEVPVPGFLTNWRDHLVARREYKRTLAVSSFSLSQDLLKEECGILYAQVVPDNTYRLNATVIDALGRKYVINLAQYGFVVQRKAKLVFASLSSWIRAQDMESAKKALSSLIGLMVRRSKKGIQDSDPDFHKNAGFIGTDAIFIDMGSFHRNEKVKEHSEMKRDIEKISRGLVVWLEQYSPELHNHLLSLFEHPWDLEWTCPKDV